MDTAFLAASVTPNINAYDLAYSYEIAVVVKHGIDDMVERGIDVIYYLTLENENYIHPPMPKGVESDIVKGLYSIKKTEKAEIKLLGSGPLLNETLEAAKMLEEDWSVSAEIWNVTSYRN